MQDGKKEEEEEETLLDILLQMGAILPHFVDMFPDLLEFTLGWVYINVWPLLLLILLWPIALLSILIQTTFLGRDPYQMLRSSYDRFRYQALKTEMERIWSQP